MTYSRPDKYLLFSKLLKHKRFEIYDQLSFFYILLHTFAGIIEQVPVFILTTLSGSLYNARTGARKPSLQGPVFFIFYR